jgi:hypothetical protein
MAIFFDQAFNHKNIFLDIIVIRSALLFEYQVSTNTIIIKLTHVILNNVFCLQSIEERVVLLQVI